MSDRDGASSPERSSPETGPLGSTGRDAELLTAYVDGVAELSPDERRRIAALLAQDPAARADEAALRTLLDTLRALPPEGMEPDWAAMAQSVHAAVGQRVPHPWWRSWRWLAPLGACAAAAVLLVIWPRLDTSPAPVREPATIAGTELRDAEPREDVVALWLDGAQVDVDLSAADLLGAPELDDAPDDAVSVVELLPATTLALVDQLDDEALARVERWLDEPDHQPDPASPPPAPRTSPARKRS